MTTENTETTNGDELSGEAPNERVVMLPCPFCGCESGIDENGFKCGPEIKERYSCGGKWWSIVCRCDCKTGEYTTLERAIWRWNKRAT